MANIEKRYFTIDNCATYYEGYDRGNSWNGWACPLFEKSIAENICKNVDDGETIITSYDKEKDCFKVKDTNNDIVSIFYGENFEIDGETKHLYPIGSGEWTWDSYTKEEMIDAKVEYWHTHDTGNSLKEFLGMTNEEMIKEFLPNNNNEPDITEDM